MYDFQTDVNSPVQSIEPFSIVPLCFDSVFYENIVLNVLDSSHIEANTYANPPFWLLFRTSGIGSHGSDVTLLNPIPKTPRTA